MTKDEAIKLLSQIMDTLLASNSWLPSTDNPIKEAFGMAISALQAQESCNNFAIDTISRQVAIDALDVLCQEHRYKIPGKMETYSQYNEAWQDALDRAENAIFDLPSADRPQGEWTNAGVLTVHCSNCKSEFHELEAMNYCPNCGADMRGNKE